MYETPYFWGNSPILPPATPPPTLETVVNAGGGRGSRGVSHRIEWRFVGGVRPVHRDPVRCKCDLWVATRCRDEKGRLSQSTNYYWR